MLFDFSQDPDIDSHLFYDQKYLNRTACVPCENGSLQKLNFYGFQRNWSGSVLAWIKMNFDSTSTIFQSHHLLLHPDYI